MQGHWFTWARVSTSVYFLFMMCISCRGQFLLYWWYHTHWGHTLREMIFADVQLPFDLTLINPTKFTSSCGWGTFVEPFLRWYSLSNTHYIYTIVCGTLFMRCTQHDRWFFIPVLNDLTIKFILKLNIKSSIETTKQTSFHISQIFECDATTSTLLSSV